MVTLVLAASLANASELPVLADPEPETTQPAPRRPQEVSSGGGAWRADWWPVYERSRHVYHAGLITGGAGLAVGALATGAAFTLVAQGRQDLALPVLFAGMGLGGAGVLAGGAIANGGAMRGRTAAQHISGAEVKGVLGTVGWICWGAGMVYSPGIVASYVMAPLQWRLDERAVRPFYSPVEVGLGVAPGGLAVVGAF